MTAIVNKPETPPGLHPTICARIREEGTAPVPGMGLISRLPSPT
jgi:hypothetical protein